MGAMKGRRGFLVGVIVGVGFTGSGLVVASIPDENGEITACVTARTGAIRVIDVEGGQVCRGNEQSLTWDQEGSPGGSGSFKLLDSEDKELGIIAGDGNGCWVVWNGTEFRSYDLLGQPCQNVLTAGFFLLYSGEGCSGNVFLLGGGTPGPRGPYGIHFPIIKQLDESGGETFRPVVTSEDPSSVTGLSYKEGVGECVNEPLTQVASSIELGDPLETKLTPLKVVYE